MSNQLKWLSAGSLALIGLSLILACWIWGFFELRLRVLRELKYWKLLMEENGTKPLSAFFPFVNLCHSSTWLASDLASRFGAILIGLLIWKIGNLSVPKTWQRVWTAILFHPAFGLMLLQVRLGDDNHFLILQMALLWTLARQRHPHLYLQLFC